MVILIRSGDSGWSEPSLTGYENEASLQQLIAEHPSLIPGVSERAVACREFSSGVGPADVVILDESGELTLVECKLTTNPQVRREIVGQVLDYASRLWGACGLTSLRRPGGAQRDGVEVLIPTAYGSELVRARGRRERVTRDRWPIEAYVEWAEQHDPDGMPAWRALCERLLQLGWRINGGRAATPSLNASIEVPALAE